MQHNKQRAKQVEHTEVKKARQSKIKMAYTTLVGMLREDGAAKSMASVMKEICSVRTERTRRYKKFPKTPLEPSKVPEPDPAPG